MLAASTTPGALAQPAPNAKVKVTQSHLTPTCLDGKPAGDKRTWTLATGDHTMAFTMRNEPRSGGAAASAESPGVATVTFGLEAGHDYEVEVRADPTTFSRRVWQPQQWTPVVRDRTTDRIVSSEPRWTGEAAGPDCECQLASSASNRLTSPSSCCTTARTVEGSLRSTPAPFSRRIG